MYRLFYVFIIGISVSIFVAVGMHDDTKPDDDEVLHCHRIATQSDSVSSSGCFCTDWWSMFRVYALTWAPDEYCDQTSGQ